MNVTHCLIYEGCTRMRLRKLAWGARGAPGLPGAPGGWAGTAARGRAAGASFTGVRLRVASAARHGVPGAPGRECAVGAAVTCEPAGRRGSGQYGDWENGILAGAVASFAV